MRIAAALLAGLVFGIGLALSGMLDPARVLGFLDITGAWDASLAFVLAGAVGVSTLGYALVRHMRRPLLADRFEIPPSRPIDAKLLGGAALFGLGWGLAGFCPGPAFASIPLALPKALLFLAAMVVGMALYAAIIAIRDKATASTPGTLQSGGVSDSRFTAPSAPPRRL